MAYVEEKVRNYVLNVYKFYPTKPYLHSNFTLSSAARNSAVNYTLWDITLSSLTMVTHFAHVKLYHAGLFQAGIST